MKSFEIRIVISNSHVHLSRDHARRLFGVEELEGAVDAGHAKFMNTAHTVTLTGPKGSLERMRVLTPATEESWVELNRTHAFVLGVRPPLESGMLPANGITIRGPAGEVTVSKNVIIEARHLEVTTAEAKHWGLHAGQVVAAEIDGPRAVVFKNVGVRVVETAKDGFEGCLELDRDEANAAMVDPHDRARIVLD